MIPQDVLALSVSGVLSQITGKPLQFSVRSFSYFFECKVSYLCTCVRLRILVIQTEVCLGLLLEGLGKEQSLLG